MKKVLLTLALVMTMSVPAFAGTNIIDWDPANPDYSGTQAATADIGMSANGIVWSRHNLSSYGEHYQATTSVGAAADGFPAQAVITTEVCVFCHTPHFGKTDTAPLWNRGSAAISGYKAYGSTVGGSNITDVGGSSLACLSCHDGITTLDNLINKPGKGSRTNGTGADAGWIFGEIGAADTIGDTLSDGVTKKATSRLNIGASNVDSSTRNTIPDLSNDHPISVVYYGAEDTLTARASLRDKTLAISGISMDNARPNGDDTARNGFGSSANLWAVKGYISDTAVISDLLRDSGGQVQCTSCHDPHYKNQTNTDPAVVCAYFKTIAKMGADYVNETETPSYDGCIAVNGSTTLYLADVDSDGLFLRRVGGNSNSGVCRTCHNK